MANIRIGRLSARVLAAQPAAAGTPAAAPTTKHYLFHNWISGSELECAYSTDITAAKASVAEERRALFDRPQRLQRCHFTGMDRNEAAELLFMLMRHSQESAYVPIYSSVSYFTAAAAGAVISCDTRYRRFYPGGRVLLYDPTDGTAEDAVILSMTSSALTLTGTPAHTFSSLACRVYPLMDAEVLQSSSLDLLTDYANDIIVEFQEKFGSTTLPPTAQWYAPNRPTYLGYPILNIDPDWGQGISLSVTQIGSLIQVGRGTIAETRGARPKLGFSMQMLALSRADAWDLIRFFDASQGRLRPFWLVNPQTAYKTTVTVETTYVDVEKFVGTDGETQIAEFTDYVAIIKTDGSYLIRGVSSVTDTGSALRITFSAALSATIAVADINRISSAHLVRFDQDFLNEMWATDEVCNLGFKMIEVLVEAASAVTNLSDTPASSSFETVGAGTGPYLWWLPSRNVYKDATTLAEPGSPSGDGDVVDEVFDARDAAPASGKPVSSNPSLQINPSGSTTKLYKNSDFLTGKGLLSVHFLAGNTQVLDVTALSGVNIEDTWFDNTNGITIFVVASNLVTSIDFFKQTGVFEFSETACKFFDLLATDVPAHHVTFASAQTIRSNEVAIFTVKWVPNTSAEVWRDGISLGTATTPIVDFPTGGGTINISGDEALLKDFLLYKEALSVADMNIVGNLLASLFGSDWTDIV